MSRERLNFALRQVGKLLQTHSAGRLPDGQLVERFAARREEAAFAALVERHGPMVFGVCRRVLRQVQDAEDAFQATFLVLARQAGSLRRPDAVGAWLYEVAYHIAARARKNHARRSAETLIGDLPAAEMELDLHRAELTAILDEELQRLPAKYRTPLVLCYFENKTYAEAAEVLGWAEGTVSGRLARARELLRTRLTRRGLALTTAGMTAWLTETASAATMPTGLATSTIQIVMLNLAGGAAAGAMAAHVAALSEGMVRTMSLAKLKMMAAVLFVTGTLLTAGGLLTKEFLDAAAPPPVARVQPNAPAKPAAEKANDAEVKQEAPLDPKVREAIKKGIDYLKKQQLNGNWDDRTVLGINGGDGGITALVLHALLEAGVKSDDDVVAKGLEFLRKREPKETYVVGLQTAVFARADSKKDRELLQRNVDWLLKTAKRDKNDVLVGWSYPFRGNTPDNSNSQYAVLALHEAARAGIKVEDQTWKEIREFYTRTQLQDGGWPYHNSDAAFGAFGDERITMTCAGVCGLLIAKQQLNEKDEPAKEPIAKGLERIAERFTVNYPTWKFYNLYGLSRAGRLSGQKEFAARNRKIDWYRAGSEHLLHTQFPEGCWRGDSVDGNPIIATSYALLFLASPPKEAAKPPPPKPGGNEKDDADVPKLSASGVVVDPQGRAVAGAKVYIRQWLVLTSAKDPLHMDNANDVLVVGTTDANGRFAFEDIPAPKLEYSEDPYWEPWDLVVAAKGYGIAWKRLTAGAQHRPLTVQLQKEITIEGRLVNQSGQPIGGAHVKLYDIAIPSKSIGGHRGSTPVSLQLAWSRIAPSAMSDDLGRFTIPGLPPNMRVDLDISHRDYQRGWARVATKDGPPTTVMYRNYGPEKGAVHEVTDTLHSRDFSFTLQPGHRLRGRVVLSDTKQPAANHLVELMPKKGNRGFYPCASDPNGRYLLEHMPPGEYYLLVRPTTDSEHLGIRCDVTLGTNAEVESELDVQLPRGQIVAGQVTDANSGKGVAGVKLQYRYGTPRWDQPGTLLLMRDAHTDVDGRFRFPVPEGKGKVVVVGPARGYVTDFMLAFSDRNPEPDFVREVEVVAGQSPPGLNFRLRRGLSLTATILDRDSRPVVGANVTPLGHQGEDLRDYFHPEDALRTDADGRFTLSGLRPNVQGSVYIVDIERRLGTLAPLSPAPDKAVTDLGKLRLEPLAAAKGKVVDEQGQPLVGVAVQAHTNIPLGDSRSLFFDRNEASAISKEDGTFEVPCLLPEQSYQLQFRADGFAFLEADGFTTEVGLTHNVGIFTLAKADQSLAGIVVDANGKPQAGVYVNVWNANGRRMELPGQDRLMTDGEGRFRFVGLARGKLQVTARKENGQQTLIDSEAGREDVKLVLP